MEQEKNFIKSSIYLVFGTFLPKLASYITLPILTACLTKDEYGTYDLVLTLTMLLLPAATLSIQSAVFRFIINNRDDDKNTSEVVSTGLVFSIVVSFVILFGTWIFLNNYDSIIRLVILAYFIADLLFTYFQQIARGTGKNKVYSFGTVTNAFTSMIIVVLAVRMLSTGLVGAVLAQVIGVSCGLLIMIVTGRLWKYIKPKNFKFSVLKQMLSYSWPMLPNSLSNWVLSLSDRLVITAVLGTSANAVYAVALKIPNLLTTVQSPIIMAWHESASLSVNDDNVVEYYSKMFDQILSILSAALALIMSVSWVLFIILIKGDYGEAFVQMPILFMGLFCSAMSSFYGGIYIAHKRSRDIGISTMGAAALNLIVDLLLVKFIGIFAGSISTLVSYACLLIFRAVGVRKFQTVIYNRKKIIVTIIGLVVVCAISSIQRVPVLIFNVILAIIYAYLLNRDTIKQVLNKTIRKIKK